MTKNKKVNIITLGCSKNTVDSEYLSGHLRKKGYTVTFDDYTLKTPIVIINTCGFIGDAKEESIDTILEFSEARKSGKIEKLIVCGCLAERYRNDLEKELSNVDVYFGVHEWEEILESLDAGVETSFYEKREISTPKHYAYLKIAEGCDRACSYCAIPLIRGQHISRPIESLVAEAEKLVKEGVKELLVISQDTTFYGLDLYGKRRLGDLLEALSNIKSLEWIRLHYTFPNSFPDDVLEIMQQRENICKYIDIPVQHIDSQILKSMKRGITSEETYALIEKFRKYIPNMALRTTLIVGYPGETDEKYEALKEFVKTVRFERLGVFQYSPEEETSAFNLGDPIKASVKQERADELMSIQEQISDELNQQKVGTTFKVLIDRKENDFWVGRTEFDSPEIDNEVLIPLEHKLSIGQFYKIQITEANAFDLYGVACYTK